MRLEFPAAAITSSIIGSIELLSDTWIKPLAFTIFSAISPLSNISSKTIFAILPEITSPEIRSISSHREVLSKFSFAYTFGKTFFSELTNIYGINYNDLKATLKKYLLRKITDKEILEGIARVSANTYDFQIGAVEFDSRLYAKKNIDSFITALEKEFEVRSIKENN